MKKNLMKCLLFISSYFPLYFFLLVLNFDQYNSYEKIKRIPIIIFLISVLICMIVSLISIVLIKVSKNGTKKY